MESDGPSLRNLEEPASFPACTMTVDANFCCNTCQSMPLLAAFTFLAQVIELGSIGRAFDASSQSTKLFAHSQPPTGWGNASSVGVGLCSFYKGVPGMLGSLNPSCLLARRAFT
eukprot:1160669-Pelagomonas_calceolata.AAC.7